jgi:hypothetical protein
MEEVRGRCEANLSLDPRKFVLLLDRQIYMYNVLPMWMFGAAVRN